MAVGVVATRVAIAVGVEVGVAVEFWWSCRCCSVGVAVKVS